MCFALNYLILFKTYFRYELTPRPHQQQTSTIPYFGAVDSTQYLTTTPATQRSGNSQPPIPQSPNHRAPNTCLSNQIQPQTSNNPNEQILTNQNYPSPESHLFVHHALVEPNILPSEQTPVIENVSDSRNEISARGSGVIDDTRGVSYNTANTQSDTTDSHFEDNAPGTLSDT